MTTATYNPPTAAEPVSGTGSVVFCPDCYPMLSVVPPSGASSGLHDGHYRRGFRNSRNIDVYENGEQLRFVEEAYELPGVRGLLLREFLNSGESLVVCRRNGHTTPMIRLRYSAEARIV